MKRNKIRRFIQQNQFAIASLVLFVAIAAMTGVYFSEKNRDVSHSGQQGTEIAQKDMDLPETEDIQQENDYVGTREKDTKEQQEPKEDVASVTSVIPPKESDTKTEDDAGQQIDTEKSSDVKPKVQTEAESSDGQGQADDATEKKDETATQAKASDLHFSPQTDLRWPLEGDVILNFSMDQTVYFATLDQYKYNPAVIIAGSVNDAVRAAATGKITDISTNEETGTTVTMDLGDGYTAIYGQLKEVLYNEGAIVEAGNAIGYIAEPTKYYSVEGSNLYFGLLKDGEPENPMQYIE